MLVARIRRKSSAYRLVGEPEGKKLLGTPGRRKVDNNMMSLRGIDWVLRTGLILPRIRTSRELLLTR
jgi:hypothetical protein